MTVFSDTGDRDRSLSKHHRFQALHDGPNEGASASIHSRTTWQIVFYLSKDGLRLPYLFHFGIFGRLRVNDQETKDRLPHVALAQLALDLLCASCIKCIDFVRVPLSITSPTKTFAKPATTCATGCETCCPTVCCIT